MVPGLAADFGGYAPAALPPAGALSLWIKRAMADEFPAAWCEQAVAMLCTSDAGTERAAVAALSYREDFDAPPPGWCLRADPVHLRADTRGLVLFDAGTFDLDSDECRALVATLNAHLAEDGWQLEFRHPRRWYLSGGSPQRLEGPPLPTVRGTPLPATPWRGDDARAWNGRLNELQMLLHGHPVNAARAAAGAPVVNSVWLWGGGGPPPPAATNVTLMVAQNTFARGLAKHSNTAVTELPRHAGDLPAATGDRAHTLVVLEDCRDAAAYEDFADWQSAVARIERDWLAPLLGTLGSGGPDAIDLYPLNGRRYRLTRRRRQAFWKGAGDYRRERGFRCSSASRV